MIDFAPLAPEDVRRFRSDMEMTRMELATSIGAGIRTIEDWEAGRRQPPALLRLAFSALSRKLAPWVPDPILGPNATAVAVEAHIRKLMAQRGDEHAANLADRFECALGGGASPAEALLCAQMMDLQDGYNPIEVLEDWKTRPTSGWRTMLTFRPEGFEHRPAIVAEARHDKVVKSLVVFVDNHRPGERLPAKVRIETALIARGFRVLSFSEVDVLLNCLNCAETVVTVIEELVEEVLFEAGHTTSAWKRLDRRQDLPDA